MLAVTGKPGPRTPGVFLSYARKSGAAAVRALHAAMPGECFLDESDVAAGDRFPEHIADALLASRVVVVFASRTYFQRRYCLWELQAALGPYQLRPGDAQLEHLVVVLPEGDPPEEMDRLPPGAQTISWPAAEDAGAVARLVRMRLRGGGGRTLAERYEAAGQPPGAARARLLELTPRPPVLSLDGVAVQYGLDEVPLHDDFVGRWDELHRIDFWLRTLRPEPGMAVPAVAIEGLGGLGKTRLAVEYVHRFGARHFPGGIIWIDAAKPLEPQLHGALKALEPGVPDLAAFDLQKRNVRAELESVLRGRGPRGPVLWVVDGVPEPGASAGPPQSLGAYCPALGQVAALITSRRRLSLDPGRLGLPLRELDSNSAVRLLTRAVASFHQLPPEHWKAIADWVGCLPLALTLLNQVLLCGESPRALLEASRARSVTEMLDRQMEALRGEIEPGSLRGVTEALSLSYHKLSPATQVAARLLARLAPAPIPMAILDRMPETFPLLVRASLIRRSFVMPHEAGVSPLPVLGWMHRIVADYLRTCGSALGEWEQICGALATVLADAAQASDWHLLQAGVLHASHALRNAPEGEAGEPAAAALLEAVSMALSRIGRRMDALEAIRRSVELYGRLAARAPPAFEPDLARALDRLADRLRDLCLWDEELQALRAAVEAYRRLAGAKPCEFEPRLADMLRGLSAAFSARGRHREALEAVQAAVEVYRRLAAADPESFSPEVPRSLLSLCNCLGELGYREEALGAAQEAVDAYRRLYSIRPACRSDLATALDLLADCLARLGRDGPAAEARRSALGFRESQTSVSTGEWLGDIKPAPSPPEPFRLRLVLGPGSPRNFSLAGDLINVGRHPDADIRLDSPDLSRLHVVLQREDGQYKILDLGSCNGLYLNGVRIHSAVLHDGDNIQLGSNVLLYQEHHFWE